MKNPPSSRLTVLTAASLLVAGNAIAQNDLEQRVRELERARQGRMDAQPQDRPPTSRRRRARRATPCSPAPTTTCSSTAAREASYGEVSFVQSKGPYVDRLPEQHDPATRAPARRVEPKVDLTFDAADADPVATRGWR